MRQTGVETKLEAFLRGFRDCESAQGDDKDKLQEAIRELTYNNYQTLQSVDQAAITELSNDDIKSLAAYLEIYPGIGINSTAYKTLLESLSGMPAFIDEIKKTHSKSFQNLSKPFSQLLESKGSPHNAEETKWRRERSQALYDFIKKLFEFPCFAEDVDILGAYIQTFNNIYFRLSYEMTDLTFEDELFKSSYRKLSQMGYHLFNYILEKYSLDKEKTTRQIFSGTSRAQLEDRKKVIGETFTGILTTLEDLSAKIVEADKKAATRALRQLKSDISLGKSKTSSMHFILDIDHTLVEVANQMYNEWLIKYLQKIGVTEITLLTRFDINALSIQTFTRLELIEKLKAANIEVRAVVTLVDVAFKDCSKEPYRIGELYRNYHQPIEQGTATLKKLIKNSPDAQSLISKILKFASHHASQNIESEMDSQTLLIIALKDVLAEVYKDDLLGALLRSQQQEMAVLMDDVLKALIHGNEIGEEDTATNVLKKEALGKLVAYFDKQLGQQQVGDIFKILLDLTARFSSYKKESYKLGVINYYHDAKNSSGEVLCNKGVALKQYLAEEENADLRESTLIFLDDNPKERKVMFKANADGLIGPDLFCLRPPKKQGTTWDNHIILDYIKDYMDSEQFEILIEDIKFCRAFLNRTKFATASPNHDQKRSEQFQRMVKFTSALTTFLSAEHLLADLFVPMQKTLSGLETLSLEGKISSEFLKIFEDLSYRLLEQAVLYFTSRQRMSPLKAFMRDHIELHKLFIIGQATCKQIWQKFKQQGEEEQDQVKQSSSLVGTILAPKPTRSPSPHLLGATGSSSQAGFSLNSNNT